MNLIITVVIYPCSAHPDLDLESLFLLECYLVEWAIALHGMYESAVIFVFILKQKNLYIVCCAQCIWDITAYFLLPEFKYIYLPIYIFTYNQTLAYTTKINFFPLHFNNFLEENLSKSPSFSQLLPVVIPS